VGGSRTKLGVSTENQLIRRQGENTRGAASKEVWWKWNGRKEAEGRSRHLVIYC